jgi:hypothetical protein
VFPSISAAVDVKLTELVKQLGHTSFAAREAAARDLINAGNRAVPALTVGMKHNDVEVAERCRQLLPMAVAAERNRLLAQLINDSSAQPPKGLPGVSRFLAITGDDKSARRHYAEMMAVHFSIVEAQETKPTIVDKQFRDLLEEAVERVEKAEFAGRDPYPNLLGNRSDVTLFLFLRGNSSFDDIKIAGWRSMVLLQASRFKSDVAGPDAIPAMKKLFLHWLANEKQEDNMLIAYEIAKEAKWTEAVPMALKAVNDSKKSASHRAWLMLDFVAVMGGPEHVKDLAPQLTDESGMGSLRVGDGPTLAPQVGDIALAVSIRLSGQKPSDFGFHKSGFEDPAYRKYFGGYGFIDDAARKAARAKWRTWLNAQQQK